MTEAENSPAAPERPGRTGDRSVRVIGIVIAVMGIVFLVAGITTYAVVSSTLGDEKITVSDDADHFAGKDVKGPFTAYAQADVIAKHAEEIGGGKTYAELAQDDPNRSTVMTASFLRASLFTSVVAFGVAAFVAVMGVLLMLLGWALMRVGRSTA
ncbi:aromatic ring-opening dioxygenase LigA [Nocardioides mangrovi]|uniref:Aromatic ring-opening dioxygenase LigA n=1 Tax=Nocardioides mangrovi TaxID=2874580 RepID=A0ABS7UHX8_9ACTN|nr:aromatic ring-opening dioxygenase LigA [Nocardioides mangrovi]MBZ5740633.1 aromatic ring-opening dioxygenase LigA [Nocardioides mangrovi]